MAHLTRLSLAPALALGLLLAQGGCGDPLVDDRFRGVVILQVHGSIILVEGGQVPGPDLRVGLFFAPGGVQGDDLSRYVELTSVALPDPLPRSFDLNVFQPPDPSLLSPGTAKGEGGVAYGIGRILAYADRGHNGRRDPGEPVAGSDVPHAVLYLPQRAADARWPATNALDAGFHTLLLPQRCGRAAPMPTTKGDCGVPLGRACRSDADCQGGLCLQHNGIPWPDGACVVTEPPKGGCRPADASFYPTQAPMDGPIGFYVKKCQRDADCVRPSDRIVGTYACDPGLGACVPGTPPSLSMGTGAPQVPLCGAF